ncbi:MAG: hypothetical protein N2Z21_07420 [Candidatus Sumerlaeaceae bacterium]|nr:hypothetical protein [Candidatus Sumerlaeaceae bacterium]
MHKMSERIKTWGELCQAAGLDPGETPLDSPVEKLLFAPGICTPVGDSKLKELGFTKLVRRDHGVYENVTRTDKEARYMVAGDKSSMPDLASRISD